MVARLRRQSNAAGSAGSRRISRVMPPPFFQGTERELDARRIFMVPLWHDTSLFMRTLGRVVIRVAFLYPSAARFFEVERISMSIAAPARQSALLQSVIGALLIMVPMLASADELPQGFSGKGQAGYVMSRGNSDTDAANAKIDLFWLSPEWKHQFTLEGLFGRSAQVTSSERWDLRLQSDYTINTKLFAFGALAYQDDRFSGFEYQASASAGLGYKVLDSNTTKLAAQNDVTATDYAQATSDMSKFQILSQTGIAALSQANQAQQLITKLLQ